MMIHRAYRYELDPNNAQRSKLYQSAGSARFVYNWGLARRIEEYRKTGKSSNAIEQHRQLNQLKKTELSWLYEVSKCVGQEALRDLDSAFKHFFRRMRQGAKEKGFPKFKRRGMRDSFRLTGAIRFKGRKIRLPRLDWIRLKERREDYFNGRMLSATVSRHADRWFVSVTVEEEIEPPESSSLPAVGVDLGITTLVTLSTGESFENPRAYARRERRRKRLHKSLSRKKKGSRNRERTKQRLAREYYKMRCLRQDTLHKLTTHLAKSHGRVVIEDLNVRGMRLNRHLAKAISDVGFGELRRQLEYKCKWYGCELVIAPRFFPSSKLCSNCGHKMDELSLVTREYVCEQCGIRIDRDLNAARNLVAASWAETENACGEDVRLLVGSSEPTKRPSVKQEPDTARSVLAG